MIEKILERLEEGWKSYIFRNEDFYNGIRRGYDESMKIVQEVAKDGGWIPVETELPKQEGMYLCTVFHANKYVPWIMRFKNGEFVRPDDVESLDYEILAWQRIAPYQKGE